MAAPQLWGGVNNFQHFLAPVLTTASETAAAAATDSSPVASKSVQALSARPVIAGSARLFAGVVAVYPQPKHRRIFPRRFSVLQTFEWK